MSPTRSPLSHPGEAKERQTEQKTDIQTDRQTHKLYIHSPNLLNVRCCGTPTVPPNSPPPPITPPIPIPANPPAPGEVRTGAEKYTDNYFRALYLLRAVWKNLGQTGSCLSKIGPVHLRKGRNFSLFLWHLSKTMPL